MSEVIKNHFGDGKERTKLIITYAVFILVMLAIYFFGSDHVQDSGVFTLLPAVFLLIFIFFTKRILEGLILGTVMAYFMIYKGGSLYPIIESIQGNLQSETYSWFLMVCGTLGGIIALLQFVGASEAFSDFVSRKVKSRKSVLLWTMILGFVIFIDDYINVLIRGTAMAKITDKYKVSREFLAYVIDSSAAAACILIPFSTWAIFVSGLLEENGVADKGQGLAMFIKTMPYNFYAICALVVLLLAILGVIKPFGPMKKAELEAQARWAQMEEEKAAKLELLNQVKESGRTEDAMTAGATTTRATTTGSTTIGATTTGATTAGGQPTNDQTAGAMKGDRQVSLGEELATADGAERVRKPRIINFLLPIIVLIAVTIYFDIDAVAGIFSALVFMFIFYVAQRIITPEEFADVFIEGVKDMVMVLLLMLFSLTFAQGIEEIGCMDYMIKLGVTYANPETFPFLIFIIFGCTEFVMGLVWSLYIIAFPIVIPISLSIGADPLLTIAAVCSAGVWGSNTCFYVDCTILSAQASGITPFRHGITQLPFALLAVALAGLCFLGAGFILT